MSVYILVGESVRLSVCHNYLKGRNVRLPCSYRSTCLSQKAFLAQKIQKNTKIAVVSAHSLYFVFWCCQRKAKGLNGCPHDDSVECTKVRMEKLNLGRDTCFLFNYFFWLFSVQTYTWT